jgi:hypothetical protein
MYKHNRRKSLRANIPVGMPIDVVDATEYIFRRLERKINVRVVSEDEQARRRKAMTATDEDLE